MRDNDGGVEGAPGPDNRLRVILARFRMQGGPNAEYMSSGSQRDETIESRAAFAWLPWGRPISPDETGSCRRDQGGSLSEWSAA